MSTRPRWAARADAAAFAEELGRWRQKCADDARKRRMKANREAKKAAKKAAKNGLRPRGIDRVPDHLRGLSVTVEVETPEVGTYRGLHANRATRRAWGQRTPRKHPRRRELAGAQVRRLERARKAWAEVMEDAA